MTGAGRFSQTANPIPSFRRRPESSRTPPWIPAFAGMTRVEAKAGFAGMMRMVV
jgi:hypothetical protein